MAEADITRAGFGRLDAAFARMEEEAASQVARWIWAPLEASWEVPLPHYAELSGLGPSPAPLKREPAKRQLARHYALDREERIVLSRSYGTGDLVTFETFLGRSPELVESVTFDHEPWSPDTPPKARVATRTVLEGGRAVEHTSVDREGERRVEVPRWSGEVLATMTITSSRDGRDGEAVETYNYQYDEQGELLVIRAGSDSAVIYRRPPKRVKLVLDLIERGLVAAIVRAVAEHRPDEPVGAIGVGFAGATWLRPIVGIQSERDLAVETDDARVRWNPADMTVGVVPFQLDPETDEAIAAINRHIEDTDDEKLFRVFQRRLAKTLNERDWTDALTPAPDFAVVAVDLDDEDPLVSVRATLPKPVRQAHAARGLV